MTSSAAAPGVVLQSVRLFLAVASAGSIFAKTCC